MYGVVCFLLLVAFRGASAQNPCVPEPVDNLTLSLNYTLSWSPSSNCAVVHYIVYIHSDDGLEYIYQVEETNLDVSFLPACERYRFTIMAYDLSTSSPTYIITDIPAPPEANLTMSEFYLTEDQDGVFLHWDVEYKYAHCAQFFRVVIWDFESSPRDIYTSYNDMLLTDLIPCTNYELGVMAIYNLAVEGPISVKNYRAPPIIAEAPQLRSVRPGVSYVDMDWNLPPYSSNRCPITQLIVDGSPFANLTIPIEDSPQRPLVQVHVDALQPDRMYLFRISMVNSGGATNPLLVAIQTLPSA